MIAELSNIELTNLVNRQLTNMFGTCDDITGYIGEALDRAEFCFNPNKNKYFHNASGEVLFSPFHSGQYSIFLYYLANTVYKKVQNHSLATKLYYLNKVLNSVDWYYELELPEYWGIEHPLASVLGRAKYSNGFFFYQGCTVGGNKGKYPVLGENVILYSNASILGNSIVGNNVAISTGSTVMDAVIPSNSLVFGHSPNLVIKPQNAEYMEELIESFWARPSEVMRCSCED